MSLPHPQPVPAGRKRKNRLLDLDLTCRHTRHIPVKNLPESKTSPMHSLRMSAKPQTWYLQPRHRLVMTQSWLLLPYPQNHRARGAYSVIKMTSSNDQARHGTVRLELLESGLLPLDPASTASPTGRKPGCRESEGDRAARCRGQRRLTLYPIGGHPCGSRFANKRTPIFNLKPNRAALAVPRRKAGR